jgi:spectinomycin phosphotransferase
MNFSLMAYPFIDAQNGFTKNLTHDQWIYLATAVKKIHTFNLPASLKSRIRLETYSPEWRTAVTRFSKNIGAIKTTDELTLKFIAFFKNNSATIYQLIERAEQLAHTLKQTPAEYVLCHGDIHAGNVLLADNGGVYIVDWDDPIMAPKERDLMFIGGGIENVWNNPEEEKFFYACYGTTAVNWEIIAYYRCERIVQDIAEYSELLTRPNHQNENYNTRLTWYNECIAKFEPNNVVDIALKTQDAKK